MRHIDERLRSELVEDNVGPRAKHLCGTRCQVPSAVASLSREKAGYEECAALSEELGDLQESPDEEIRRLTELFRTGYLHARDDRTSKRDRVSRM